MRQLDKTEKYILLTLNELCGNKTTPLKIEQIIETLKEFKKVEFQLIADPPIKIIRYRARTEDDYDRYKNVLAQFINLMDQLNNEHWLFLVPRNLYGFEDGIYNTIEGQKNDYFDINRNLHDRFVELFDVEIYLTKGLLEFINQGFKTEEEIRFSKTYRATWIAIAVAFATLVVTNLDSLCGEETFVKLKSKDIEAIIRPTKIFEEKIDSLTVLQRLDYSPHIPTYKIAMGNKINIRTKPVLSAGSVSGQLLYKGDLIIVQKEKRIDNENWLKIFYSNDTGEIAAGWVCNRPGFFY